MSDDFEGIPLDFPAEVPAETQADGAVTEDYTGEQVANEGGNPAWWDDNYPGQTVQNPDTVTENVFDPRQEVQESVFNPAAAVPDPYLGLTPEQLKALGNADPTDPYIRARLGIPQLPGDDTLKNGNANLTFLKDLATAPSSTIQKALSTFTGSAASPSQNPYGQIISTAQKALSALTTKTPVASPYPSANLVPKSLSALTSNATAPTQDAYGLKILDAAQTQQLTRNVNPAFINSLVDPNSPQAQAGANAVNTSATAVDTGAGEAIAAANQQTAADAARLNAQSPNPYLTNIDIAAAEISKGHEGIATANQTIQSAQQKIADSESIIAQNNAELANSESLTAARQAELEAANAAQAQNIFDQTQSITENQAYIATTQETIQFNEATIDTNSAGYRATTAGSNVPVVDVNTDPSFVGPQQITATVINPTTSATAVDVATAGLATAAANVVGNVLAGTTTAAEAQAIQTQVGRQLAQQQAVNAAQKKSVNNSDWRVRLSLAPGARYLYNAPDPGILDPLTATDGVIFPYTPKIDLSYKADYDQYALTHSNYKGYFYKSSSMDAVQMHATFTAQDSAEADYLLAVIHFFRSVTKMFYGQDPQRGAPPPLVYLTGLGQYQFAAHPCVVTSFSYTLPENVDYIRARSTNINGTNLLTRRVKQDLPTNPISGAVGRLATLFSGQGISYGAEICRPPPPTLGQNQPTYVPTKLDISLNLLPMQTRQQVSREFSLRGYASGELLKKGFW